jgi:hypothetical protein
MRRFASVAVLVSVVILTTGCSRSRTFTIYAKPANARLIINGVDRGNGPITQQFNFGSGGARVMATSPGYQPREIRLTANTPRDTIVLELDPLASKAGPSKAILSIEPPAMVRVNGRLVSPTPVTKHEITFDATDPAATYLVTADQPGYGRESRTITAKGPGYYSIKLKPLGPSDGEMAQRATTTTAPSTRPTTVAQSQPVPQPLRREIVIRTDPPVPNAEIYIAGEKWGDKEVRLGGHTFKRDPAGRPVPEEISAVAPGFEGGRVTMRWEDNKTQYVIPLGRRRKDVHITTDPPGATVAVNGKPLRKDPKGVSSETLYFPPTDPPQGPTTYAATVAPPDASAGYEPGRLTIGWDEGRQDYAVKLTPSKYVNVPMLRVVPTWEGNRWRATAERVEVSATRDTAEGAGRATPLPLPDLPAGTMLDSVIAAPDGARLLYTEILAAGANNGAAGAAPVPVRARLRLIDTDGTPAADLPSDGRSFDAMPSFTPDGGEIVFTSDRAGQGLDVWSMKAVPKGAVRQLARGGEKAALWPTIDASPSPRLFYEQLMRPASPPAEGQSQVHMVEMQADPPTNKALSPGSRPRVSPRADAVVFTRPDPLTGKRDLYLITEKDGVAFGGQPVNLTRTPDVDEFDPAWSRTGGKIAYAADASTDDAGRRNYDVFVLTVADPSHPVRITLNGSRDDSPAWDPTGRSLYFRSNRGGKWGIWKAAVP